MNRRSFLRALGIGTAALVLDPELALWRPGAKTFFLPSVEPVGFIELGEVGEVEIPWDGDGTLVTPEWIMREALTRLENNLKFSRHINRSYDAQYLRGDVVNARLPVRLDMMLQKKHYESLGVRIVNG